MLTYFSGLTASCHNGVPIIYLYTIFSVSREKSKFFLSYLCGEAERLHPFDMHPQNFFWLHFIKSKVGEKVNDLWFNGNKSSFAEERQTRIFTLNSSKIHYVIYRRGESTYEFNFLGARDSENIWYTTCLKCGTMNLEFSFRYAPMHCPDAATATKSRLSSARLSFISVSISIRKYFMYSFLYSLYTFLGHGSSHWNARRKS